MFGNVVQKHVLFSWLAKYLEFSVGSMGRMIASFPHFLHPSVGCIIVAYVMLRLKEIEEERKSELANKVEDGETTPPKIVNDSRPFGSRSHSSEVRKRCISMIDEAERTIA